MKTILTLSLLLLSFSSLAMDKMVIGKDDRHQIKERNKQDVHNSIGVLIEGNGKKGHCTGTIIGPRHVLTATHCIGAGKLLHFIPGNIKRIATDYAVKIPKKAIKARFAVPFPGYREKTEQLTDLSIVVFEKDFTSPALTLSLFQDAGDIVTVAGYPDDKGLGTMWEDSGVIMEDGTYTLDTFGGQSGSAVRNKNNEVIGVHIFSNSYEKKNYALILKQEHIDFINEQLKKY